MDQLKLQVTEQLKIYCVAITHGDHRYSPTFMLSHSLEGIQRAVIEKFKGQNIALDIICVSPFTSILKGVDMGHVDKEKDMDPEVTTLGGFMGKLRMPPETAEQSKEKFINGLRLVADRFVDEMDRKTLLSILKKVENTVKVEKNTS